MTDARARWKRGTAAEWTSANPVLRLGEPGWETDTKTGKVGDGVTPWNSLEYHIGAGGTGGGGTVKTVNGENPDGAGAVVVTASDVGLGAVNNTADTDKPVSDATQTQLDSKSNVGHDHDDRYFPTSLADYTKNWYEGDAAPSWVASGIRPAGLRVVYHVSDSANVPDWTTAGPLPKDAMWVRSAPAVPLIRDVGGFTAATSDINSTVCTIPSTALGGDMLWLCVASNSTTPTTPSGWSVLAANLSSGASNSDGIIIYSRTAAGTVGAASSDAGTTVTVALGAVTAAVGTVICWKANVAVDVTATSVDDANTATSQSFPSVTPTTDTTIIGVSAVRYNALAGGTSVNARTGWTETVDRTTAKAGAPQRGLVISVRNAAGAASSPTGAASTTATQVVRTANRTLAVKVA